MELKSVNGANYLVISKLLQRNAWAAQYEANDALEQGFSSDLIQCVANYNLFNFGIDDMIEDVIELVLEDWIRS